MKVLVIICSHEFNKSDHNNIKNLNNHLSNFNVDYCGISGLNDFANYEDIINFKYKMVTPIRQLSKICNFISNNNLDYDWYIKIRPDVNLLEMFDFNTLSNTSINARARQYTGPKQIKYGMSVNGPGAWRHIGDCHYGEEEFIVLDDMMYVFHNDVIKLGAFDKINLNNVVENEWIHTSVWKDRNINLNVIGIHLDNTKYHAISGNINC